MYRDDKTCSLRDKAEKRPTLVHVREIEFSSKFTTTTAMFDKNYARIIFCKLLQICLK